jgi:hypothetical protein
MRVDGAETADVPFAVIGVPFRRGMAASSELEVSFSFIHTNHVPVFTFRFALGRKCFKTRSQIALALTIIDGF